ncbi:MAG TPA: hypothetical protein PKI41_13280 [Candidatus Competibacteraceae bacterium]|nr:MAG: DUF4347 domain-containing protein [Candidatus Competibacteraceae bacterium]HOB63073.1 hypothetical protein [Candidatus Competibacteraceae bacterium]HQD57440.1 hypothetical protein [Candidatus Competibacteraceae bacterium]
MAGSIDLCVTDANGFGVFDYRFLNRYGNGQEIRVSSINDTIGQIINIANQRSVKIKNLYFNGHGAPGYQGVGSGTGRDTTGNKSLQVDPSDKSWNGQLLGAGSSLFLIIDSLADGATVTLSGCRVAEGTDGKVLLRAVATTLNVWVQAADATQFAWIPGWEGKVWKCSPDGQILCPNGDYT